jgi:hypothetical protein
LKLIGLFRIMKCFPSSKNPYFRVYIRFGLGLVLGMKKLALFPLLIACLLAVAQNPSAVPAKFGCLSGNCENGTGKFRFKDDAIYEGQWKNGKQEGKGKLSLKDGAVYLGDFRAGKMQGKGRFTLVSSDYLEGDFNDDRFEGQGVFIFKNGIKMGGTYVNNTIKNGYQISPDSSRYDGDFQANLKNGKGVMQYKDGLVYSGDWVKDKREGKGELKDRSGKVLYNGNWAADTMVHPEQSSLAKNNFFNAWSAILKRHFTGGQELLINGNKGNIGLDIDFNLFEDYSLTAICITKMNVDGKIFTKKARCIGKLDPASFKLTFSEKEFLSKDEFTYQLQWQYNEFDLTLYTDASRPGHYIMNSISKDANALRTELKDN